MLLTVRIELELGAQNLVLSSRPYLISGGGAIMVRRDYHSLRSRHNTVHYVLGTVAGMK
jgi:hypothetical protein